ncbi:DNA primase, partial [Streptomyces sp. SF28]|nr:DNA primase [Streptomyces pinistramenti]
ATTLVRLVRPSSPGQRNARLFRAACRAYETGLGTEPAGTLTVAARRTGPPERETRATLASAAHHSVASPTAPRATP